MVGCLTFFVFEIFKQNNMLNTFNKCIYPFLHIDISIFILWIGASLCLKGVFESPEYKNKKIARYYLLFLLITLSLAYIALRILFF